MLRVATIAACVLLVSPPQAPAWGFEAHRFIASRAAALLPVELRPFFEARRAFVAEHSVDPDLWRTAGFEGEGPRHHLDLDSREFGEYPFARLPRAYDAAVQRFGRALIQRTGTLPWRTQELFGKLQRAFERLKRSPSRYGPDDIAFLSAVLGHYVSDAHVPLHSVVNYDGQLTGQHGLHARWETELFERSRDRLKVSPAVQTPVTNPGDAIFEALLASHRLSQGVFDADARASRGRKVYDDRYFAEFGASQMPVVERRLSDSIAAVASTIAGAWEHAGRPSLPLPRTRPAREVSQP